MSSGNPVSRSDAWNAFMNRVANYSPSGFGAFTIGNPKYWDGNLWAHTNVTAPFGPKPTQPANDLGLTAGSALAAAAFVTRYVTYAQDYARVRMVTHRRLYQTGGSSSVTHSETASTALNSSYVNAGQVTQLTNAATNPAPANVAAGNQVTWAGIDQFATNLGSLIESFPGTTLDNNYCHSNCHSNVVKGRSRR